jgi:hypothetical protein
MPDGRSFLIDGRRDEVPSSITVMRHWSAGLAAPPAPLTARVDATRHRWRIHPAAR